MENSVDSMVSLGIKTWGARASLLVDPMSLALRYGNYSIGVRDSSLAVEIDLRSNGEFFATISGLSEASKKPLIPTITIPILAEVIFDLKASNISLSPILTLSSKNSIDNTSVFYDVVLDTFIDSFGLDIIFTNLTTLLTEIAEYGPNLTVGDSPSEVIGLFDVVNDVKEFSSALQEFIRFVDDGEISSCLYSSERGAFLNCILYFAIVQKLIPSDVRSVVRHGNFHSRYGCSKPSNSFNDYAFNLLNDGNLSHNDFNACDYVSQLQVALNYTSNHTEAVSSFDDLVVLANDHSLSPRLQSWWGTETNFTGEFLLQRLGALTVSLTR